MTALLKFDFFILDFIQQHLACPFMDTVMVWVTKSADLGLIWIIPAVICLFFKKTRKIGITVLISLAIALIVSSGILKPIFSRLRPFEHMDFTLLIAPPHGSSFPSSHTVTSFAAATAIFLQSKRFGIPAIILAAIIAFSRMYLYVHFLSDILVGAVLGIAIGLLGSKLYRK